MNEEGLEYFAFYRSYRDAIEQMNNRDKLATLLAIIDYALYGLEPELKGMPLAVFTVARPSIDVNRKKIKGGQKGGRPKKEKPMVSEVENDGFSKSESTYNIDKRHKTKDIDREQKTESIPPDGGTRTASPEKALRKKYGEFGWIRLSDQEYERLVNDLGKTELERCIAYVDTSAQTTGNKNKWRDWNLVLRRCSRERWGMSGNRQEQRATDEYDDVV